MNATGGVALGRDDLSSPACSSQASSRSPSPLGKLSEFYNKNDYGRPTTPTAMVPPTFMRKEKLSAVLLSEDVPLSANTLRIPPAHRDLVTPGGGGSAGCRTRPGSSGGGGRKSDPLGKNVSVTDDREVDNDEKFAALKWQKKPGSPNANNARKKPRRRVDEIHISAYVSVDWPLCMGPPVDVWKRRQRVVSGLTGTGTYSTKELVRRLMGVDGFNSGRAALDGPGAAATDNAGGVMIQPPQLGVFGGNMYLDTANDRGGPAHDMLRKSRSTTQIGLQTTLGRTLFSAHSGAARIVNMSRSVNPQECEAKPGEIPQLSDKVQCDCCEPPKAYLRKHKYVYVLFYAGAHPNKINADIFQKYTAFFEEWKHTNVAFGKVDIDMDKQFSDEWLEPNQIPTNILFKDGEPIVVAKEDFQKALSLYQGSPEGHRVLLDKYFGGGLHYTKVLDTAGKLKKFLKNKEPVGIPLKIVGVFPGFKDDHSLVKGFRAGVWKQGHNMLGWRSDQLYSEDKYQQAG
eukprot:g11201.t1